MFKQIIKMNYYYSWLLLNEWTRVNVLINPKKTVNMLIIIFEYRIVTT